jgi:PAS domain S-box-containing protein
MDKIPLTDKYIQEDKFRALAENIPGVIYLCNNDATYSMLYLNNKVEELTGYTPKEFLSGHITFLQLYHPDDAPLIFQKVETALANEESFNLSYRMGTKSGEWRWVEEVGTGVYHQDSLLFIEGFINDVTAQKLAEEQLQKVAEENFRLFNNAVNLSVIAGFDGHFKRLNPTWFTLLGWTEAEMLSKSMFEFIHPDDIKATNNAIKHMALGNNLSSFENRYRCKDGSYKWLLWSSASDVKRSLLYASAIDITERKKFEAELLVSTKNLERASKELQRQNNQLSEFAHIISHNLRSPVGNIQALISLLNENSTKEDYSLIFEKLKNTSASLSVTLNDLLETLHVHEETNTEKSTLLFEDVFFRVKHDLEGELMKCDALLTFDFNSAPEIEYSKTYLESIILNLLSNAIKYRSPDRRLTIHISTARELGRTLLRVTDNGLGINLSLHGEKIFGFRKTFHENTEARGVGLFLIKTQIETLGGSIFVESEEDKGATFVVIF